MLKRRLLGMPFPVAIALIVILSALFIISFIAGPLGRTFFDSLDLPDWLSLAKPAPELPAKAIFHVFGFPITNSIITAWISMILLVGLSYAVTRRMKIIPGRLQMAFEFLLGWLYDFCCSIAGEKNGRTFFPVVATIFLFVAFNAWLALLPGYGSIQATMKNGEIHHLLKPANTDLNMPLAIATVSVVMTHYFGIKTLGIKYPAKYLQFGRFFNGAGQLFRGKIKTGFSEMFIGIIEIIIGILEFISEFIHIISFTARLFGNMTAGEILLLVVSFLVPFLFALPFYGLELLVGFIQALIFSGLTLIFMTLAVASHNETGES